MDSEITTIRDTSAESEPDTDTDTQDGKTEQNISVGDTVLYEHLGIMYRGDVKGVGEDTINVGVVIPRSAVKEIK